MTSDAVPTQQASVAGKREGNQKKALAEEREGDFKNLCPPSCTSHLIYYNIGHAARRSVGNDEACRPSASDILRLFGEIYSVFWGIFDYLIIDTGSSGRDYFRFAIPVLPQSGSDGGV